MAVLRTAEGCLSQRGAETASRVPRRSRAGHSTHFHAVGFFLQSTGKATLDHVEIVVEIMVFEASNWSTKERFP
jgi:hypothetical protein